MEKLFDLQDAVELKICQTKANLLASGTESYDLKQEIEDRLSVLENEMAYYATCNNMDITDAILIEWLEKYHEIVDNLLLTSKSLI